MKRNQPYVLPAVTLGLAAISVIIASAHPAHAQASGIGAITILTDQLAAISRASSGGESLSAWFAAQFKSPQQEVWTALMAYIAAATAPAAVLGFIFRLGLTPIIRKVEGSEVRIWWARIPMALGRFLLVALPALVFAAAAVAVVAILSPDEVFHRGSLTVVTSIVTAWLGLSLARAIFAPMVPTLRPLPLSNDQAVYLFIWSGRFIKILVFSALVVEISSLMSMPAFWTFLLEKGFGLLVALLVILIILQSRKSVAAWIEGAIDRERADPRGWHLFRARLGDIWHVLSILYVTATWIVWAIEIPGGFDFLALNTSTTAIIVALAWVSAWVTSRGLQRLFGIGKQIQASYPFVAERANIYLPLSRRILITVIQFVAILAILRVWGLNVWGLMATDLGRIILERAVSISLILAAAVIAWEASSAAIRIYMERTDQDGNTIIRSKRARTLLPLIRNALLVLITIITVMVILSELGISIGPILAGAGVAGLAVGFGAQTLVKDFITGMFILFEDSIHVGDVVRVAGKAGTVEALTIRTVQLRDLGGVVHTVPFSSVDVIENMTKDYSQAVIDLGVGYQENYDDVVKVLKTISEEMRADPDIGPKILEPMLVLGLNELADSAIMIRVRIKTEASQQWAIRREFNRRVKQRFDELGIEIPYPHRTVYFGEDQQENVPPLLKRTPEDQS